MRNKCRHTYIGRERGRERDRGERERDRGERERDRGERERGGEREREGGRERDRGERERDRGERERGGGERGREREGGGEGERDVKYQVVYNLHMYACNKNAYANGGIDCISLTSSF